MNAFKEEIKNFDVAKLLLLFKTSTLEKDFVKDNLETLYHLLIQNKEKFKKEISVLEDNNFTGWDENVGGNVNFTAVAENPAQRSAMIDEIIALNKAFVRQYHLDETTLNKNNTIALEAAKDSDFKIYNNNGKAYIGLSTQSDKLHHKILPFFEIDENMQIKILSQQSPVLVFNQDITGAMQRDLGLSIYKKQLLDNGMNADLELGDKIKHFAQEELKNQKDFSLSNALSSVSNKSSNLFSGVKSNVGYEDILVHILNESKNILQLGLGAFKRSPTADNTSKELFNELNTLLDTINNNNKDEDKNLVKGLFSNVAEQKLQNSNLVAKLQNGEVSPEHFKSFFEQNLNVKTNHSYGQFIFDKKQVEHAINNFKLNTIINFGDLSEDSKNQLGRGQTSNLIQLVSKDGEELFAKLQIKVDLNTQKLYVDTIPKNSEKLDLTAKQYHGKQLTPEDIQNLENGKDVKIEIFNKDGNLQSEKSLSLDNDLNQIISLDPKPFMKENPKESQKVYTKKTTKNKMKI